MHNWVTEVRVFIVMRPWLFVLVSVLTLGNFASYQIGWEDGVMFEMDANRD